MGKMGFGWGPIGGVWEESEQTADVIRSCVLFTFTMLRRGPSEAPKSPVSVLDTSKSHPAKPGLACCKTSCFFAWRFSQSHFTYCRSTISKFYFYVYLIKPNLAYITIHLLTVMLQCFNKVLLTGLADRH